MPQEIPQLQFCTTSRTNNKQSSGSRLRPLNNHKGELPLGRLHDLPLQISLGRNFPPRQNSKKEKKRAMSEPQVGPAEPRLICNSPQWQAESRFLSDAYSTLRLSVGQRESTTTPSASAVEKAVEALPKPGSPSYLSGLGSEAVLRHINEDIVPALNGQNLGSRYYGFVTGGALPVAEAADNIVSALDQNVHVHLPSETVATAVEDAALGMVTSLLRLEPEQWPGRIFTTGATASNVLGLACGREAVISQRLIAAGLDPKVYSVGDLGLLQACIKTGVHEIQVLTSMGHSSLYKAASIVGIGRRSVKALPLSDAEPFRLDIAAVENETAREGVATIIAVSAGEVNTSGYATSSREDMVKLRAIADRYGAWIHVDGAFGIFARALPQTDEFSRLQEGVAGLELASSITADGHKLLNVVRCPFLSRVCGTKDHVRKVARH